MSDGGGEPAFAKLHGRWMYQEPGKSKEFEAMIRTTAVRLGRVGTDDAAPDFISLGDTKLISRHHATISWIDETDTWQITCMSKNGLVVDRMFFMKGETVPLIHKSTVKLGPCAFYFLLPSDGEIEKAPGKQKTYGELVRDAFASGVFDEAEGVTSLDIKDWVVANVPAWQSVTSEQQIKLLTTGIQAVLYREKGYEKLQSKSQKYSMWRRVSQPDPDDMPPLKRFAAASPRDGPLPVSEPVAPAPQATATPASLPQPSSQPSATLPHSAETVTKPIPSPVKTPDAQTTAIVPPTAPQPPQIPTEPVALPRQSNTTQPTEAVTTIPEAQPLAAPTRESVVVEPTAVPVAPVGQAETFPTIPQPLHSNVARPETVVQPSPAHPNAAQGESFEQTMVPESSRLQQAEGAVPPTPAAEREIIPPTANAQVSLVPTPQPTANDATADNDPRGPSPPASGV